MNAAAGPSGQPVDVTFSSGESIDRLWGIPILGLIVRAILIIPHAIVLWFLGVAVALTMLISWIPVLLSGRQADWIVSIGGGYLRYATRVVAYLFLLSADYPPIASLSGPYGVDARVDRGEPINRFWGIPIVGHFVRYIILIPHLIVLFFVGIVAMILLYFSWLPVLILGRQAAAMMAFVGGYLRYSARVSTFLFLIHDRYPPFRLSS